MFEAGLSHSVGWDVNPVLDRKLLEERVKCSVARERFIGCHDGVGEEAQAIVMGQSLLTVCHRLEKEGFQRNREEAGMESGGDVVPVIVGGGDSVGELVEVPLR